MPSTLQKVAGLAVPHFADWCAVDMVEADGALRRLAVAHVDPSKVELAHELHRRHPPDPAAPRGAWNILRTGKSEVIPEITDDLLDGLGEGRGNAANRCGSWACGPTWACRSPSAARRWASLTFVAAESGRRYDDRDLAVAEDLAHRAAVAIENARLYQRVREADRRKDEFLAMLAHELRNPLAPIRNAAAVLGHAGADARDRRRGREMIERQVTHLARLVDDLLDVSRIASGKIQLQARAARPGRPGARGGGGPPARAGGGGPDAGGGRCRPRRSGWTATPCG